jgi:hypothetical protein
MVRMLMLCLVVTLGFCLSTHGVLGQSGESSQEKPNGKFIHEENRKEINKLNGGNGPPQYRENGYEYSESVGEISEIGNEIYELAIVEPVGPSHPWSEIFKEEDECGAEVTKIQNESNRELSTQH